MADGPSEASRVASRIRLMSAELYDEPVSVRTAHIENELKRAMEGRSRAERQAILEELRPLFPSVVAQETGASGTATAAAGMDTESALSFLEAEAASMSDSERQLAAARLARAGYSMPGGRVGWSPETEERIRSVLRLREGTALDPDRVTLVAAMLADALVKLDDAAWAAWREIAPRSQVRQRAPLRDLVVRFVEGDENTPTVTLEGDLEQTRVLTALLVGSTGRAASAAWEHVRALLPSEIEQASGARGKHRKLWVTFEELAQTHLTSHAMEGHMRGVIEKDVQEFMLGRIRR